MQAVGGGAACYACFGMRWKRIALGMAMVAALATISSAASELPGDPGYAVNEAYADPLRPSARHPGPCGAETLNDCIACCNGRSSTECLDWVESVYGALDGRPVLDVSAKLRGVWLPTLDAVREAARRIPQLKSSGIDAVSFGPDIVTHGVREPRTVGDRLVRFYARLFHTAGFRVHLVPNAMHWGHNDVSLRALTPLVVEWAREAEALGVSLYAVLNEVDGMREGDEATSAWLQDVLPLVRERYTGLICVQPTQTGFKGGRLDVSGYDAVSPMFSLMVPDPYRNLREVGAFLAEAERVRQRFPSVRHVLLTDVATFSGGNWAETSLMEGQARALAEGRNEYADDAEQAGAFGAFLAGAYPAVDGCFFNLWIGFGFLDRPAEDIVRTHFAADGRLPEHPFDALWSTPGFLETVGDTMLTTEERAMIFDLGTYVAGWAGLCHEPSSARPGPFGCTSLTTCMEWFRREPEVYWRLVNEACRED